MRNIILLVIRKSVVYSLFLTMIISSRIAAASDGLSYDRQKNDNHVIHVLTIDPKYYRFEFVKGHNQVFGRETVKSMAIRKDAVAAINGGFFEIGGSEDGRPSGTLIINDNIFNLSQKGHTLLSIEDKKIDIKNGSPVMHVHIGEHKVTPGFINQLVNNDEIALYNHTFGPTSLTPFNRLEIAISPDGKITDIFQHGDNPIPASGWLISLPTSHPIGTIKKDDKVNIDIAFHDVENKNLKWSETRNLLMGIPMIVNEGQAITDPSKLGNKSFSEQPHARTAIGIKSDGTIVIAVVEHAYTKELQEVTVKEIYDILKEKGYSKQKIKEMPLSEMLGLLKEHLTDHEMVGLSLPELAKLMVTLGCTKAINLDGGGSSTLFLNGKVMNTTLGDKDESLGQKTLRPVSDALVILKR